jgi:hypothetical protein
MGNKVTHSFFLSAASTNNSPPDAASPSRRPGRRATPPTRPCFRQHASVRRRPLAAMVSLVPRQGASSHMSPLILFALMFCAGDGRGPELRLAPRRATTMGQLFYSGIQYQKPPLQPLLGVGRVGSSCGCAKKGKWITSYPLLLGPALCWRIPICFIFLWTVDVQFVVCFWISSF